MISPAEIHGGSSSHESQTDSETAAFTDASSRMFPSLRQRGAVWRVQRGNHRAQRSGLSSTHYPVRQTDTDQVGLFRDYTELDPLLLTFFPYGRPGKLRHRLVRPAALVPVAQMGPLPVVEGQPGIQVPLQRFDALVEPLPGLHPEELFQHRAVEAFHETVRLRTTHLGAPVLDVVELQVRRVRMALHPAKFSSVVGQHRFDPQPMARSNGSTSLWSTSTDAAGCLEVCRKPKA